MASQLGGPRSLALGLGVLVVVVCARVAPATASAETIQERTPISTSAAFGRACTEAPFGAYLPEAETEPHLAVNPIDPQNLAAAWIQGDLLGVFVAVSFDGGWHWKQVAAPLTRCTGGTDGFAADPWLAFGPEGTLYLAALVGENLLSSAVLKDSPTRIVVLRSNDGGLSWTAPTAVVADGYNERPTLAVDRVSPSRLYILWSHGDSATYFATSSDAGDTWTAPRKIYQPPAGRYGFEHTVRQLPDGALLDAFLETGGSQPGHEQVIRSQDHGETWSAPFTVADVDPSWPSDPEGHTPRGSPAVGLEIVGNPSPTLDVSGEGWAYVAWAENVFNHAARVGFSRSTDGGREWSAPSFIVTIRGQALTPTLGVDPSGVVGVMWYDSRNDRQLDAAWTLDVWLATSPDRGWTWSQLHLAGPLDARALFLENGSIAIGDYFGMAAVPDGLAAVFTGRPSSPSESPQDVWFARVKT